MTDPVTAYAEDVVAWRIAAGRPVRLLCRRHLNDLARSAADPLYPYAFDPSACVDMLEFFHAFLTLDDVDEAGEPAPFALCRWLQFCFGSLLGWRSRSTGYLRYQEAYLETGKGSTKTPAAAGFGLYRLVAEGKHGVELYSLGVNGDQANYLYGFARRMAERSEDLKDLLTVGEYNMAWVGRNSFFRPLTSEGRSLDNKRPFLALIDELHEHATPVIPEKMRLGIKSQVDALVVMLTNSGHDKTTVCWTKHDYGIKVLEGVVEDDQFFPYICQLDPCEACRAKGATVPSDGCPDCDDWTDEAVWPKVQPALVDLPALWPYLRTTVRQAQNQPSTLARIKRLNFCVWTQGHSVWIGHDVWERCRSDRPLLTEHGGRPAAAGFDMSEKLDLTACAIGLRVDDDEGQEADVVELVDVDNGQEVRKTLNLNFRLELRAWFWLPEETMRKRSRDEAIPYDRWARDGWIRVTPGPVIDYDQIYEEFRTEIAPPYKPDRVGYDKHNASQFALQLRDKARFTVAEVQQGRALSETFKLFEALVRLGRVRHDGNPVLAWCLANADPKRDRYENLWLEKPSASKRIDGVIAAVIMLSQLMALPARRRRRGRPKVWTPAGWVEAAGAGEARTT